MSEAAGAERVFKDFSQFVLGEEQAASQQGESCQTESAGEESKGCSS